MVTLTGIKNLYYITMSCNNKNGILHYKINKINDDTRKLALSSADGDSVKMFCTQFLIRLLK